MSAGQWSSERLLQLGEWWREARHLPEARTLGAPRGRPSDPAPTTLGVCETAGVRGAWLGLGCTGKYGAAGRLRRACRGGCARPDAPNAPRLRGEGVAAGRGA